MLGCEVCRKETDLLISLPIRQNEYFDKTEACLHCAQSSPAFCLIHSAPHIKYEDDTTACRLCLDDSVERNWQYVAPRATIAILGSPDADQEMADLKLWAKYLTKDYPFAKLLSRLVIARHMRTRAPIFEIIAELSRTGAQTILPPGHSFRDSLRSKLAS